MEVLILPKTEKKLWAKEATVIPSMIYFHNNHFSKATNLYIENHQSKLGALIPNCIINNDTGDFTISIMYVTKQDIKFEKNGTITNGRICVEQKNIKDDLNGSHDISNESVTTACIAITATTANNFDFDKMQIEENVSKEGREKLKSIVKDYISCFSYNLSDLGTTNGIEFKIELTNNDPVIFVPAV